MAPEPPAASHHAGQNTRSEPPLPFRQRAIYIVAISVGAVIAVLLIWQLRGVLTLAFASILFAVFLRSGANLRGGLGQPGSRTRTNDERSRGRTRRDAGRCRFD